jgi:hypothetical protein
MLKSGTAHSSMPHTVATDESCPLCDQPIPHDRFDEIKARIASRQLARMAEITSRLQEDFAREKADALELARREAAAALTAKVASAREAERRAAEATANEKFAEAARIARETQVAMQARIERTEAAKIAAEKSGNALKSQLDQARRESEAAIQKVKKEAEANAAAIREDSRKRAEVEVQEKIAGLERAQQQSEANLQERIKEAEDAKSAAVQSSAFLQAQLEQMCIDSEAAIEKARQDAETKVIVARQEVTVAVEAAMQAKIAGAEKAKADAEAQALAAEQQALSLQETYDAQLTQRLHEQREALERAQTESINAERSAVFEKQLKLSNKIDELQRALDNKTAEELGEGAELDLYEVLKSEFEGDRIERINKGQPGADILHTVIHNEKECGSIIYDSKNHKIWRNDFVTKLAADQMAAKADHAILSTRKFPEGRRHVHVQDGVILAAPSRVAAVVQIIRQHIVRNHTLRLSDEARTQKTAALYSFITSQRCSDLFARIDTHTDDLLDLQVKEKKAHEVMWKKEGELLRSVQKVRAEICNEIETIIGTFDAADRASNE